KIMPSDMESLWSLIEILKLEKAEITFTKIQNKTEIMNLIDNPTQLTFVATTKNEPNQVLSVVKGRRELSKEKAHAVFLSAATHPQARGNNLAIKLTNFALEEMKKEGINIARIYVYSNNQASLNA